MDFIFLFLKIIKGKRLIANFKNPENPSSTFQVGSHCEHVGEVFGECDCVCFCDIPNQALSIHTEKYGKFGLGFDKTFIAEQGAHPVMYVPINYPIIERGDGGSEQPFLPRKPNEYYPHLLSTTVNLLPLLEMSANPKSLLDKISEANLTQWLTLFDRQVFCNFFSGKYYPMVFSIMQGVATQMAYIKLYDATLPDTHPDNYYMEREWRSLNNVSFNLNDIKMIYIPNKTYQERFTKEVPEYTGEFYVFEEKA